MHNLNWRFRNVIWDKGFKSGPSKICERQPLKNLKDMVCLSSYESITYCMLNLGLLNNGFSCCSLNLCNAENHLTQTSSSGSLKLLTLEESSFQPPLPCLSNLEETSRELSSLESLVIYKGLFEFFCKYSNSPNCFNPLQPGVAFLRPLKSITGL